MDGEWHATAIDPADRLSELIEGYWSTQVIGAALQLDVPAILGDDAATASDVARRAGGDSSSVERLLRAMVTLGLCVVDGERFELTGMGRLLRPDVEGSASARAVFASHTLYPAFAELGIAVRTGRKAPSVGGAFESSPPEQVAITQAAMAEISRLAAQDCAEAYDFGRFGSILDVGGGFGGVLAILLYRYPHLRGSVFDLPNVEQGANAYLADQGLADRATFIAGSFTDEVPSGHDCYCLKYILHDWADDKARLILATCRRAMAPDATLVILELVVPDRLQDSIAHRAILRADMAMMTWGGKERTAEQHRRLLAEAGFEVIRIVPTASAISVIEARPA